MINLGSVKQLKYNEPKIKILHTFIIILLLYYYYYYYYAE